MNALERLEAIRTELADMLARGETSWHKLADDYQSKYAFSADYDKSLKNDWRARASGCLRAASAIRALEAPVAENAPSFAQALANEAARAPLPLADAKRRGALLEEAAALAKAF